MHPHEAYSWCQQHLYRYVRVTTKDGRVYDGFIADVDSQNVTLAIPIGMEEEGRGKSGKNRGDRQFGFFGRRRFRRRVLPLFLLSSLFLLPFFGGGYGGYPYFY